MSVDSVERAVVVVVVVVLVCLARHNSPASNIPPLTGALIV